MSEMSVTCTKCSESVLPSFLSDHVCGGNPGGMAGVGRRGFQHLMLGTPPMSPLSFDYGLRTPSPLSPRIATPTSPFLFPSPHYPLATPAIRPQPALPPLSIPVSNLPRTRTPSHSPTPKSPLYQVMAAPTPSTPKFPYLEKYKSSTATTVTRSPPQQHKPQSLPYDEDEIGLAYDRDVDDPQSPDLPSSPVSASSHSIYSSATRLTRDFLSSPPLPPLPPLPTSPPTVSLTPMSPPRRSHTAPTTGPRGGTAGVPSPLGPSSPPLGTVRSISDAKQHHHSRRPRDSDSGPDFSSGSTFSSSLSPKKGEVVTTTATSPTSPPGSAVKKPRVRICVKCDVRIENGRWIRMDGGKGILCEICWKTMYLPRCRRCSKVIETAAVFSSDGQLKGKYHRHCFTCSVCDTPFPSNTFWIYDGQPMCEYHYHESNRSLCAAKNCRKPIDGTCAITDGDFKYHPACLVCSTPGCKERLEEYWEIEGRMMCERHAKECESPQSPTSPVTSTGAPRAVAAVPQATSHPSPVLPIPRMFRPMDPNQRLQKRTTRLINIQSALAF